jgi:GT2 family glycosyltransferase
MVSIIICSRTRNIPALLENNIKDTIGIDHEIIVIDNTDNQHSIFTAYNLGVKQSKYPYLCFMHDDITFHSKNWGIRVVEHFNDELTGAIGIAGNPYLSYMPGPWWGNGILYEHLLQSTKINTEPVLKSNIENGIKKEISVFDGLWFCIKKELFENISFDEQNFKGFHFYDLDICMQLHNIGSKIYCINNVLIHHSSMGSPNNTWIESALIFHKKWAHNLPACCININYTEQCRLEYKTLNSFIWICSLNGWSNHKIYRLALKYLFKFKRGYLFYKTPGYFSKFAFKMLFKKGAPFYSI